MIPRVIEIQNPGNYLSVSRGHLVISKGNEKVGSVPLADIGVLLISNPACSLSIAVLNRLIENGAQVIVTGDNFVPSGALLPLNSMVSFPERFEMQFRMSKHLKNSLWSEVIALKVANQIAVLESVGQDTSQIRELKSKIKAGDPSNIEAQVARIYWPLLYGHGFRRDRTADGVNALLNYGYTILRAATTRAIVASGLSPAISLHHSVSQNPMALSDDLMEIYRPLVDMLVYNLYISSLDFICPDTKKELASLLTLNVYTDTGFSTIPSSLLDLCASLLISLQAKKCKLKQINLGETIKKINCLDVVVKSDVDNLNSDE
jgi:CRISPR-associated protein Cas1